MNCAGNGRLIGPEGFGPEERGLAGVESITLGCYRRAMLVVAGSINMDLVAPVPHIPGPGQTVLGGQLGRHHGGKGANQAVAAARLGAAVRFFGAVGRDAFGDELIAGLRAEGIATDDMKRVGGSSGCALISVDSHGENAIAVLPGANQHAPLPPAAFDAKLVLLQLEIPLATVGAWVQAAASRGIPVMLNAAPMAQLPRELLAALSLLVVNRMELNALLGSASLTDDSLDGALAAAAGLGLRRIVLTLGADGCRVWDDGRISHVPGRPVEVVDTTGAGDAFVGALAAGVVEGLAFEQAVQHANVAASLSCRRAGARDGMPHRAAVNAAMNH